MINLSKLIVTTTASYCIRKSIKQIDYFVSQESNSIDNITVQCLGCYKPFCIYSSVSMSIYACPYCKCVIKYDAELNSNLNNTTVLQQDIESDITSQDDY